MNPSGPNGPAGSTAITANASNSTNTLLTIKLLPSVVTACGDSLRCGCGYNDDGISS